MISHMYVKYTQIFKKIKGFLLVCATSLAIFCIYTELKFRKIARCFSLIYPLQQPLTRRPMVGQEHPFKNMQEKLPAHFMRKVKWGIIGFVSLIFLFTTWFTIAPEEVGVVSIGFGTVEMLVIKNRAIVQRFTLGTASGVRRLLEIADSQKMYSLGDSDLRLRQGKVDLSTALPIWER